MIELEKSTLLIIDIQARLMPAIDGAASLLQNAGKLIEAAAKLSAPIVFTEQNPAGLGPTISELAPGDKDILFAKNHFDATKEDGFLPHLPKGHDLIVAGCEAHVCVLQTVLGLMNVGRRVFVVSDAVGSRSAQNKTAAIRRMEKSGANIVSTEMVLFEWLQTSDHPRFKDILKILK